MSTREFWKRQIIIARRHRRPASYGFYCPAREEDDVEGLINGKRKKFSRLACIESDEPGMNMLYEQDSVSCNNDTRGVEEDISDNEGELTSLINKIEVMKKERSKLWLEEFKDWIDQGSESLIDEHKISLTFGNNNLGDTSSWRHHGECSRYMEYVSDLIMTSADGSSRNVQETNSFFSNSIGNSGYQWLHSGAENGEKKPRINTKSLVEDHLKFYIPKGKNYLQNTDYTSTIPGTGVGDGEEINASLNGAALTTVKSMQELMLSSGPPVSPPHYEEDILYRRYSLEEEILQISAESFSSASSDSNTSCDEVDRLECGPPSPKDELYVDEEAFALDINWKLTPFLAKDDNAIHVPEVGGWNLRYPCGQQSIRKFGEQDNSSEVLFGNGSLNGKNVVNVTTSKKQEKQDAALYGVKNSKRKPQKRVVSLSDSTYVSSADEKDGLQQQTLNHIGRACGNVSTISTYDGDGGIQAHSNRIVSKANGHIENYFNSVVADSSIHETCMQFVVCNCIVGIEPAWSERQVAVVLSSKMKLYVILLNGMVDGSGNSLSLMTSHKVEDVSEVLIGLGLLVIWIYVNEDMSYQLITRCKEKTRQLLNMIGLISDEEINKCCVRSVDQVQLNLFDRHVAGSSGISIYQYCMVLFQCNYNGEDEWISRSLFVIEGHLVVCIEDILHFSSLTGNKDAASYFVLDSCCSIANVSAMVIEAKENQCVTLTFREDYSVPCLPSIVNCMKLKVGFQNRSTGRAKTWKLKWFSAENVCKFATLLNAIHGGMTTTTLSITYIS